MDDVRLAQLLVRAIDSLPEEDRAAVLAEMVGRTLGRGIAEAEAETGTGSGPGSSGAARERWRRGLWAGYVNEFAGGPPLPTSGDRRNVLVRFDQAQHERLKAWCQAHDFSMATVLRGLVDRFLESQTVPDPDPADPAETPADTPPGAATQD